MNDLMDLIVCSPVCLRVNINELKDLARGFAGLLRMLLDRRGSGRTHGQARVRAGRRRCSQVPRDLAGLQAGPARDDVAAGLDQSPSSNLGRRCGPLEALGSEGPEDQ